ncbi:MAG: hypothetical protein DHS20C16_08590 [Phycisphaerae bacterium]|nr:MAG: hypothetical protein DHS20C16_08590 [Phycisphaerae bacterium]
MVEPLREVRQVHLRFSDDLVKGDPVVPGGSLKSKPTWLNTLEVFVRVGFLGSWATLNCPI